MNDLALEHSDTKERITILIVNSKPRKKENRARWPAIFVSMIMIIGIFAVMPVQATDPVTTVPTAGPAPVNLGTAGDFVILAQSGITTTGVTSITGDIGVSPIAATAITGFGLVMDPSGEFSTTVPTTLVTGKVYAANYADPTPAKMGTAVGDMGTAYTDAAGRPADYTELYAGDVTGQTLTPGCYKWGTGLLISAGGVTISGAPNDVWIFQIAQDLTVANTAIITLDGGAQASNIFWQVASQAVLGTTSQFKGIILCQTQIVIQNGASLEGRALAQTAVTTDANNIDVPLSMLTIPAQVDDLNATHYGLGSTGILLQWNIKANATSYVIYRTTSVNGTWGWTSIGEVTTTKYNDTMAYADAISYAWVVHSKGTGGENMNKTNSIAYKLCYNLTHSSTIPGGNQNWISLPYVLNMTSNTGTKNDARALRDDIRNNVAGVTCNVIAWWDPTLGTRSWAGVGAAFTLVPGRAYSVTTNGPGVYKIVGAYTPTSYTLAYSTLVTGGNTNRIALPYNMNLVSNLFTYNNARALRDNVTAFSAVTCTAIAWWDPTTGLVPWAGAGDGFALLPGRGYQITINSVGTPWTCPVTVPGP